MPSPILTSTLRAIARAERAEFKPPRLTEPGHVHWHRVRRKLGWRDFIALLHEDLADAFPTAFAFERLAVNPVKGLDEAEAEALVREAAAPDDGDRMAFLRQVARTLDLPPGGNIADAPRIQAQQSALELPGCGGRIAAYQAPAGGTLAFHEQFSFVADSDEERVAIGIAALEVRAGRPRVLTSEELRAEGARGQRFDRVFGVHGHAGAERLATDLGLDVRWV